MPTDMPVDDIAEPGDAYPVHPTRVPQELIDARMEIAALQGEVIGLRAVSDELRKIIRRTGDAMREAAALIGADREATP